MGTSRKRATIVAAVCVSASLAVTGLALAHDGQSADDGAIDNAGATHGHHDAQHGGDEGHLPPRQTNVEVVSKLELKNVEPGKIADVGVLNGYAYLAAWGGESCTKNGVYVVDIKNPASPKQVAFVPSKEGSAPGEGVQAVSISTKYFTGDILVTNNEKCKEPAGFGGMNIYDVSKPTRPTPLAVGIGDTTVPGQGKKDANDIHSVFAWDAGDGPNDKAYAAIVDNEEGADLDIFDISNPKKPVLVREYDLDEEFPQILQAAPSSLTSVFLHDLVVKKIGDQQIMLASYWDGGYVQLDVTKPADARYIGDTDFTDPDPEASESGLTVAPEGNAHQAEFTTDGQSKFVLAADEDFSPYALTALAGSVPLTASSGSDTTPLPEGTNITGTTVFFGRGCIGDPQPLTAGGAGDQIAVVERGECTFTEKVASVFAAGGYEAVLIFNREGDDACNTTLNMSVEGAIPTFGVVPRDQGLALFGLPYVDTACRAPDGVTVPYNLAPIVPGTPGPTVSFESKFDGWGYVHLYEREGGKMSELDTYAIPEAHDSDFATGFGDLSVHEVAVSLEHPERASSSDSAGGLRVVTIEGDEIVEKGSFIDEGGNNFWGVQTFVGNDGVEYVAASDRDFGLYIFKYTGP